MTTPAPEPPRCPRCGRPIAGQACAACGIGAASAEAEHAAGELAHLQLLRRRDEVLDQIARLRAVRPGIPASSRFPLHVRLLGACLAVVVVAGLAGHILPLLAGLLAAGALLIGSVYARARSRAGPEVTASTSQCPAAESEFRRLRRQLAELNARLAGDPPHHHGNCPQCGQQVRGDAHFCANCGARVER